MHAWVSSCHFADKPDGVPDATRLSPFSSGDMPRSKNPLDHPVCSPEALIATSACVARRASAIRVRPAPSRGSRLLLDFRPLGGIARITDPRVRATTVLPGRVRGDASSSPVEGGGGNDLHRSRRSVT
jgi:hypothetical protein